jgi:glycosyltransferase involved in cell wall biosynthesis
MNVGFFSPLPPARTGVADYSAALLAELRRHGPVDIAPDRCDIALYHIGNNPLHAEIYRRALAEPGVVVLHDAVLQHFLLGQFTETQYVDEFVYNYGEWNRSLGHDLWRQRANSAADERYFRFPMLRRIAEQARAVVVHNPAATRIVHEHAPTACVVEIPHLFAPPSLPGDADVIRYRQRIGLDPGAFVFGVFGYLRESKRLAIVLDAFAALHQQKRNTALLIAGDFVSPTYASAINVNAPGIVRVPHLPDAEFWLAARAIDACINLRYPAAGETSGIAIRMMGIGKPVLLTDAEECSRIPEDACLRIAAGIAERESLLHHMILLTSISGVARAVGERGAGHIAANHRVTQISKQYWELLCESWH